MTDIGWGNLQQYERFGKLNDIKDDFKSVPYLEARKTYKDFKHASHAMFFARDDSVLWDLYKSRAAVLMQMRFDGVMGFPGGLVEPDEDPTDACNRELMEEMALNLNKYSVKDSDHLITYINEDKLLALHFFAKQVSLADFKEIERCVLLAKEYGIETLGIVRPPIYTMGDGFRGLPAFLTNSFSGNAKEELLFALKHFKILTDEECEQAKKACKEIIAKRNS